MYRRHPLWYRDGHHEVLGRFSDAFSKNALLIRNLHAMPGFPGPSFESDGVHLTAYSGMEFVLHLFDRSKVFLSSLSNPEERQCGLVESVRLLSDQMISLQQDHQRLSSAFDTKSAVDSELACFQENQRNEDSVLISGLERLPNGLTGKAWQEKACKSVEVALSDILGRHVRVLVVHNVTGRGPNAVVSYTAKLESVEASREVRRQFGQYFTGGKDSRPTHLKDVSVSNVVTKATRVRIAVLKVLGKRYHEANPGSQVRVVGYESRPLLRLVPPTGVSDKRPKTFNYIEAVTKLSTTLVDDDLAEVAHKASGQFPGKLRELFVILSDDRVPGGRPGGRGRPTNKRGPEDQPDEEPPSRSARSGDD
jgi:hypothetical protein